MMQNSILDLNVICGTCNLAVLEDFENKINWDSASVNPNLSIELIRRHISEIDWEYISQWATLDILLKFEDKIDFFIASCYNPNVTRELIRRH